MRGKVLIWMTLLGAAAAPVAAQTTPPGWIGVMQRPLPGGEGVVIDEVVDDSPASRAGLQRGDTIVLWNGRRDVADAIQQRTLAPGDTVRLRVRRGSERDRELAVVAARRPGVISMERRDGGDVVVIRPDALTRELRLRSDSLRQRADSLHRRLERMLRDSLGPRLRALERAEIPQIELRMRELEERLRRDLPSDPFVFEIGRRAVAGAEFAPLNEGLASYFGVERGVLVLAVAPETPAARAGLQAGDVVVGVNGSAVDDIAEIRTLVARAQTRDTRRVQLEVLRRGQRRELEMRWE